MVYAGAVIKEGKTKLAERFGDVPARNLPVLVRDLVKSFLTNAGQEKDFRSYMGGTGVEVLKSHVEKYKNPASFDEDKNFYFDWEADNLFNLLERRGGECSAGLYDLIGVDLNNIRETRAKITETVGEEKRKKLNDLLLFSARTLLITRAVEAKNEQEIFAEFRKHFILTDLVDKFFDDLLIKAGLFNFDPIERESEIIALSQAVEKLYESMDNTFNFNKSIEAKAAPAVNAVSRKAPVVSKDLRGVQCPLNFAKTKVELSKINSGDILEIWLDDGKPVENVPGSVQGEGHKIISRQKVGEYWKVVIEKK
jgi:sulfite reductase (ferredoxin)